MDGEFVNPSVQGCAVRAGRPTTCAGMEGNAPSRSAAFTSAVSAFPLPKASGERAHRRLPRIGGDLSGPTWTSQVDFLARGIGFAFIVAGITALVSLVFPPAMYGSTSIAALVAVVALVAGATHTARRTHAKLSRYDPFMVALATVIVTLGVYAGGAPVSGAMLFYLWVVPYAFASLSPRQAMLQAAWMALCYAIVLDVQSYMHPRIASRGDLEGLWFLTVVTVIAVGLLVRALARSLRDVDRRFHRAFRDSQIGAAFVATDGRWLEVNDALCNMLGQERGELVGAALRPLAVAGSEESPPDAVSLTSDGFVEFEQRYLRPDGELVWVEFAASLIMPDIGTPYLFGQYRDVTAHRRDRDALAHQAVHDPLTGLHNRTLLGDRLNTALARGETVAVIALDLDGFKLINDSLGHPAGDQVLIAMAPRLAAALAPTDTLARLGGDEFVVLCERIRGPLDALDRASRLAAAVTAPVDLGAVPYTLSASAGIALSGGMHDSADALLRDADAAMYRAKTKGRGRIELFDHTMRAEAVARLQLEQDLQVAIEQQQFVLEYQPIVDTESRRTVAFEALVRWDHPVRGRIPPDAFIPLAEETGLIAPIGDWVLASACAQLAIWQEDDPELRICVNVSPVQLSVAGFVEQVAEMIRRTRIAPGSLCVEITESVIVSEQAPAAALAELKALGALIVLDDFGTGYSSLAYLTRFPIDTLKIDRGFIAKLDGSAPSAAIPKAIIAIAHELGLSVVAEGVETERHLDELTLLRCPNVQGYAIARPLPAADVPRYLAGTREHPSVALSA